MASLSCMNSIKRAGGQRPTAVRPPAVILFDGTWDRSGSTSNIYHAQMLGLQKCVSDRREDAAKTGARCLVSITTFDDEAETFTSEWSDDGDEYANIKNIPELFSSDQMKQMLKPRGCTRLVDTAFDRVISFEKKLKKLQDELKGKDNDKVVAVFALSTDGIDNASKRAVWELNEAVRRLRKAGVEMMFLAANQDAIATGKNFGFAESHTMTFGATPATAKAAFKGLSQVTREASDGVPTNGFSESMRHSSAPPSGEGWDQNAAVHAPRSLKMTTCMQPSYPSSDEEDVDETMVVNPSAALAMGLTPHEQYLMNISGATSVAPGLARGNRVTFQ